MGNSGCRGRFGETRQAMRVICISLATVLCLGACSSEAIASPTPSARAYPPPGSPDPGPPCQRKGRPPWLDFFCKYMTVDLWQAAGKPEFSAPDGSRWIPWFYGGFMDSSLPGADDILAYQDVAPRPSRFGFLEAMLNADKFRHARVPQDQRRFWSWFRYTPWSIYFEREAGCRKGWITNPYDFVPSSPFKFRFPRSRLLGLGWSELAKDPHDPTRGLGDAAMLVMMSAANLADVTDSFQRKRIQKRYTFREEVDAMARGKGELHPDYARDAEVWLVGSDGPPTRLDNLDTAAAYVVGTGVLMTNEAYTTLKDGLAVAKLVAAQVKGAVVDIYFAQDMFYPVNHNRVYRRRLQYLVDRAVKIAASDGLRFKLFGAGRSAPIVAHAVKHRKQIRPVMVAPVPGPWGLHEYEEAVLGSEGPKVFIAAGSEDFVTLIGGGTGYRTRPRLCLGSTIAQKKK